MPALPDHLTSSPVAKEKLGGEILKGHQRDRVIHASINVFAEHGYSATTVDDLVKAARVGVGNFYELLGGKEECFAAVLSAGLEEVSDLLAAVGEDKSWGMQLVVYLDVLLEYAESERAMARVILIESMSASAKTRKAFDKSFDRCVDFLSSRRKGDAKSADSLEFGLAAGAAGVLRDLLERDRPLEPARDDLARFLLRPFLNPAEVRKAIKR